MIELTAKSSSEDSFITGPQLELVAAPVTAPQALAPADVTSKAQVVQALTKPASTTSTGVQARPQDPPITLQPQTSGTVPQTATQGPAATGHTENGDPTTQSTSDSTRSRGFMAILFAIRSKVGGQGERSRWAVKVGGQVRPPRENPGFATA